VIHQAEPISLTEFSIDQLYTWAQHFDYVAILRSNPDGNYTYPNGIDYDQIIGIGAVDVISCSANNAFHELDEFQKRHRGNWIFGHLGYDLKKETEQVLSHHPDEIGFADLSFFLPRYVFFEKRGSWFYAGELPFEEVSKQIVNQPEIDQHISPVSLEPLISKESYLEQVYTMQQHIQRGDIYEANFCQLFSGSTKHFKPLTAFKQLMALAPTPFAAFYKNKDSYLLCASPERFISKQGTKLISQPIKGTAKRGNSKDEDKAIANRLRQDPKEQAENVMIVDLVRNDLSHFAKKGSVKVPELFGCYAFPQVHQLISTVSAELENQADFIPALKAAFPMGSMTGAPKKRAMEIIEALESFRRGLFSGSVGYIDPNCDADFNVVIRSILYNANTGKVMCPVGGAITINAKPEKEYEESLLKAEAIISLLKG